ncbi:MAG: hypothetical protein ABMA64_21225 [Myxococcota bacterium]
MSLRFSVILAALGACDGATKTTPDSADSGSEPVVDSGTPPEGLSIVGSYVDVFGSTHEITEQSWTVQYAGYDPNVFTIAAWDDEWLVAQNAADNAYFPDLWSRFDWVTGPDGHLYYCQTAYAAADRAEAEAAPRGDDVDPGADGCGGFPWTDLTP